jgi:pyruvate ferredoxin oxidoreductase beta subunit
MPANKTIDFAKLAVMTNFWPLYEIENGKYTLNFDPKDKALPMIDWLKSQGRFKHLLKPGNKDMIVKIQEKTDKKMDWLRMRASENQE